MVKVGVVGAGGLVGRRMVETLSKRNIPGLKPTVTGLGKSVGSTVDYMGEPLKICRLSGQELKSMDFVLLCTPAQASRELVGDLKGGPVVIDTSSAFRMDPSVPLVVPEVNPDALRRHNGLVAGPNCSTIPLVMVLHPLGQKYGLTRVHVATYQAVSGVGYQAMAQLEEESRARLSGEAVDDSGYEPQFPHTMGFNLIPHVDDFLDTGYTKEEMKMVNETRKILGQNELQVSSTCVRVPVFISHSEECLIETKTEADPESVRSLLAEAPGITVLDDPSNSVYPMPSIAEGREDVFVGRVRKDLSRDCGLLMWIVSDNLLRGAATNACNILETLLAR